MKILIGGAGNVGRSIVDYLSQANNDIIVTDTNKERLDELAKEFDVQTLQGSISHPGIMEKMGAKGADILIAVTDNDEVNLVCLPSCPYIVSNSEKDCESRFRIFSQSFVEYVV